MKDIVQTVCEIDAMTDAEVRQVRDEALRMARHNCDLAAVALAVLAKRGHGMPKLANTLKVIRDVGALGR